MGYMKLLISIRDVFTEVNFYLERREDMPAEWTAEVIGEMHRYGITGIELARHLGISPKYFSALINSRRQPRQAEDTVRRGLEELIAARRKKGRL